MSHHLKSKRTWICLISHTGSSVTNCSNEKAPCAGCQCTTVGVINAGATTHWCFVLGHRVCGAVTRVPRTRKPQNKRPAPVSWFSCWCSLHSSSETRQGRVPSCGRCPHEKSSLLIAEHLPCAAGRIASLGCPFSMEASAACEQLWSRQSARHDSPLQCRLTGCIFGPPGTKLILGTLFDSTLFCSKNGPKSGPENRN